MYGGNLDVYNFLLQAKHLPEYYDLWDITEVMKEEGPGFTLHFNCKKGSFAIPFSLGKFLVANKALLNDESFIGKDTFKELSIKLELNNIHNLLNNNTVMILQPSIMKILADLHIQLYISN
jgi:hypothetical protein